MKLQSSSRSRFPHPRAMEPFACSKTLKHYPHTASLLRADNFHCTSTPVSPIAQLKQNSQSHHPRASPTKHHRLTLQRSHVPVPGVDHAYQADSDSGGQPQIASLKATITLSATANLKRHPRSTARNRGEISRSQSSRKKRFLTIPYSCEPRNEYHARQLSVYNGESSTNPSRSPRLRPAPSIRQSARQPNR